MPSTTSRLGLVNPIGADAASELRVAATASNAILDNASVFLQGTLASRPAASIAGRYYLATDDSTSGNVSGSLWFDTGSGWVGPWNPASRGSSIVAASQSRTNTAYGTLATPDQVTNIVLPTSGLIAVGYQATWQESVVGAARAAIFLNATQLQTQGNSFPTVVTQAAASGGASANLNRPLASCTMGLISTPYNGPMTADASTGQVLGLNGISSSGVTEDTGSGITTYALPMGGLCHIFAAAGTYTVSVQFKSSSGSVTASNRRLYVEAKAF